VQPFCQLQDSIIVCDINIVILITDGVTGIVGPVVTRDDPKTHFVGLVDYGYLDGGATEKKDSQIIELTN
jgi:hypothetical protein